MLFWIKKTETGVGPLCTQSEGKKNVVRKGEKQHAFPLIGGSYGGICASGGAKEKDGEGAKGGKRENGIL